MIREDVLRRTRFGLWSTALGGCLVCLRARAQAMADNPGGGSLAVVHRNVTSASSGVSRRDCRLWLSAAGDDHSAALSRRQVRAGSCRVASGS
jgi:hypothetical protein